MPAIELLIPCLLLVIVAIGARFWHGTWVCPGALYGLYYSLIICLALSLPGYPILPNGLYWIALSVFALILGCALGAGNRSVYRRRILERRVLLPPPRIRLLIALCSMLGLAYVVLLHLFVSDYYHIPLYIQTLNPFLYIPAVLGGMYAAWDKGKHRLWFSLLSILPEVSASIATSGRSGLFNIGALFLGGYFSIRILLTQGQEALFSRKRLTVVAVAATALVTLSLMVTHFRGEKKQAMQVSEIGDVYAESLSADSVENSWTLLRHGFTGGVPAFCVWFERAWGRPGPPHFGAHVFGGPLDLLGLSTREPHDSIEIEPGVYTNVYTAFRPLIEDFTFGGSLLFLFFIGLITGWAYRRISFGATLPVPLLVMFYTDVGNGGMFFRYNSIVITYIFIAIYVYWWRRSHSRRPGRSIIPRLLPVKST